MLIAFILVVLIIYLFLGNLKAVIVPAIALPVSLVASFLGLLFVISWPLSLFFCLIWIIAVKALKYSGAAAIISLVLVILLFKMILHIQFTYNTLLWIPGTQYEFNIIALLSALILLKHYSNIISFLKK